MTDSQKVYFLKELRDCLNEGGKILIGDVAFATREEWAQCKKDSGDAWDGDELYCVAEELSAAFPDLYFEKVTFCSGVLVLSR